MLHPTWGHWVHHVVAPLGISLLFGMLSFFQARAPGAELVQFLIRPMIVASLIWLLMVPFTAMVNGALKDRSIPLLARLLIASVLGAMPLSFLLPWVLTAFELGGWVEDLSWMPIAVYDDFILQRYLKVVVMVALVWCLLNYRWYKTHESSEPQCENRVDEPAHADDSDGAPEQGSTLPAFAERMTKSIGRDIWAVQAEQHYIRVYTELGEEMVLYRFGDALRELSNFDGLQVHRSFWVAAQAVEYIEDNGNSWQIKLRNDIFVPVSRSFKKIVVGTNWSVVKN